jgi:hypothetical protein
MPGLLFLFPTLFNPLFFCPDTVPFSRHYSTCYLLCPNYFSFLPTPVKLIFFKCPRITVLIFPTPVISLFFKCPQTTISSQALSNPCYFLNAGVFAGAASKSFSSSSNFNRVTEQPAISRDVMKFPTNVS